MEFDEIDEITTETQKGLWQPQPKGREDIGIVDSFMQGTAIPNQLRANALNRDLLQAQKQQFDENMKFIPMNQVMQGIPQDMQQPIAKLMQSSGYIKDINGTKGMHQYQFRNFQKDFSQNKMMQATAISESVNMLKQQGAQMTQQFQPLKQKVDMALADFDYRANALMQEAETKRQAPPAAKLRAIELEKVKYMRENPEYQQFQQMGKAITELQKAHYSRINALGLIDAEYEAHKQKYGPEAALMLATNQISVAQLEGIKKMEEKKAEMAAYRDRIEYQEKFKAARESDNIEHSGNKRIENTKEGGKQARTTKAVPEAKADEGIIPIHGKDSAGAPVAPERRSYHVWKKQK